MSNNRSNNLLRIKKILSKGISILTFPGFIAAAGFGILCKGVYVSNDIITTSEPFGYIHFSGALFGYVLVPLLFVFFLLWQKTISSITMPVVSDRIWGFLGAVAGAFQVFIMTWFDAPQRAGRELKMLSKYLDIQTVNTLKSTYLANLDPRVGLLVDEIQAYTLVVLVCLSLMYVFVLMGRKLSIHMCGATAVLTQLYIGLVHLYDQIPEEQQFQKAFSLPWGGLGSDWRWSLSSGFLFYGGAMLVLIYWARRSEKAHSHWELLGGLALGILVPLLGCLM